MLSQKKTFCLTWLFLIILLIGSACTHGRFASDMPSRTYYKPYDTVWEAVTGVVLDDLGCVERMLKKNKGYLETEWVHNIDTDGHHRWRIEAYLKQTEGAVLVQLNKTVQMKDDVSKTMRKYDTTSKTDEPVGPHAGWSNETATNRDIENLYRKIDLRLGE